MSALALTGAVVVFAVVYVSTIATVIWFDTYPVNSSKRTLEIAVWTSIAGLVGLAIVLLTSAPSHFTWAPFDLRTIGLIGCGLVLFDMTSRAYRVRGFSEREKT